MRRIGASVRVPECYLALVPGGQQPRSIRGHIERGHVLGMGIRHPRRLQSRCDVEEQHLALAHDGETRTRAVEAERETAAHGHGGHLRPHLCAGALSRLPEPQGPLTVPAQRGEQIAARREREGHDGLMVSPEGDRLSICGRPDSDPPAPLAGRHVADVAGQRDRVKKSTGRVHLGDIRNLGGHHGSERWWRLAAAADDERGRGDDHRQKPGFHFDARTIGPVGAGVPPSGSSVTAKTPTAPRATSGAMRWALRPLASTPKSPAARGVPPVIVHSA